MQGRLQIWLSSNFDYMPIHANRVTSHKKDQKNQRVAGAVPADEISLHVLGVDTSSATRDITSEPRRSASGWSFKRRDVHHRTNMLVKATPKKKEKKEKKRKEKKEKKAP